MTATPSLESVLMQLCRAKELKLIRSVGIFPGAHDTILDICIHRDIDPQIPDKLELYLTKTFRSIDRKDTSVSTFIAFTVSERLTDMHRGLVDVLEVY
jgi:hypothetical protein